MPFSSTIQVPKKSGTTQWPPSGLKTMYFSPKNIREMENRGVQER